MRTMAGLELDNASWVHWFNTARLHSMIGHAPQVKYQQAHYGRQPAQEDPISGEPSVH